MISGTQRPLYYWVNNRNFLCVVILTLSSILSYTSAIAGWKRIAQFETTVYASFFFDENRGFIALDGHHGILRTSDGGETWINCTTPNPFAYQGFCTDIFMTDSLHGWAGIENGNQFGVGGHGLWYTTDGGVTWLEQLGVQGQPTSVYETPAAVIFGDRFSVNNLSINTSKGIGNFSRVTTEKINGINFVDQRHGVASAMTDPHLGYVAALWTSDGGLSWYQSDGIYTEAWGVYAQKGSPNFIISGEKVQNDQSLTENVYASTDYGVTWQLVGLLQGRTTGHIAGVGSVIYVQSETNWNGRGNSTSFQGMHRSTDGGKTWKNVGGPVNYRDTRFSVTGCIGGVVYAFDESGGVWKTVDGGDGLIHEPPHNPNLHPSQLDLSTDMCHYQLANLFYNNLSCNPLQIESIGFIDSTDPIVSTGALSITKYPSLPETLDPTKENYVTISWDPKKYGIEKPLSTTYVKIHSTMQGGTIAFDTLIPVNSESFLFLPNFSLSTGDSVNLRGIDVCSRYQDTLISYMNLSCDTLWLDSAVINANHDWQILDKSTLLPLKLPIGISPNEREYFLIRFIPSVTGSQNADLRLHFTYLGLTKDTVLSFSGMSYRTMNAIADQVIDLQKVSICRAIDTVVWIHNLNCDSMVVNEIDNNYPTAFEDITGINLPYSIPSGGSFGYRVRFNPLKNKISTAYLTIKCNVGLDSIMLSSLLTGTGVPGNSGFQTTLGSPQILFPDRVACSTQDSIVFNITNPGCDTLAVTSSSIAATSGLTAISYKTEPTLPTLLTQAGDNVRVVVYLQAQNPSINDGTLKFSYRLSDGSIHDSSFIIHALVNRGERAAILSHKVLDMGMGSLCKVRDTAIVIENQNCPNLTVEDIALSNNYFNIRNQRTPPFDLANGESDTVHVLYNPTAAGSESGTLTVTTNADKTPVHVIPLSVSTRDLDHITFRLEEQDDHPLVPGDTALFAFIPNLDWSGKGLRKIDFSIITYGNLLWNIREPKQSDANFSTLATTVSLPGNMAQLNVHISSTNEIVLHKDKPLVSFYYATALTDTLHASVRLTLLSLNDADPHYLNCILSPESLDDDFVLTLDCGSKTLRDFFKGEMPVLTDEIHPNPVTALTNYQAIVPFTSLLTGEAQFDCYDALGKNILSKSVSVEKPGKYSIHFDASKIAGGTYEYILKLGASTSHGRIVVMK